MGRGTGPDSVRETNRPAASQFDRTLGAGAAVPSDIAVVHASGTGVTSSSVTGIFDRANQPSVDRPDMTQETNQLKHRRQRRRSAIGSRSVSVEVCLLREARTDSRRRPSQSSTSTSTAAQLGDSRRQPPTEVRGAPNELSPRLDLRLDPAGVIQRNEKSCYLGRKSLWECGSSKRCILLPAFQLAVGACQ